MIAETVTIVSLFALLVIFLVKLYNASQQGQFYQPEFIFMGFIVGWVCWVLIFMSLSGAIVNQDTIVTPDNETYTIATNDYVTYNLYLGIANLFAGLVTILTIFEVIFMFNKFGNIRQPLKARGKNAWR